MGKREECGLKMKCDVVRETSNKYISENLVLIKYNSISDMYNVLDVRFTFVRIINQLDMVKKKKEGLLLNCNIKIEITNDGTNNKCSVSSSLGTTLYDVNAALGLALKNVETLIGLYIQAGNKEQGRQMSVSEFHKMMDKVTLQDIYDKLSKDV